MIIVYGSIFRGIKPAPDWLRGFGQLFYCPLCMGFWVGSFLFCINKWTELFTFEYTLANFLILSCVSSGTSYLLAMLIGDMGIRAEARTYSNSEVIHHNAYTESE